MTAPNDKDDFAALDAFSATSRNDVVHMVRDVAVRAPKKYPASLTITVNLGLLRSIENPIRCVYLQSRR